jgi:putative sigma-54 modulation protein
MKVSTTARHCELDPEVRIFIQQRLERLLRYVHDPDDIMEAHVVVAAEKYRHSAEITLKLRRGECVGREVADDARAAIDLAGGRIEAQLRRHKGRLLDRKRPSRGRDAGLPAEGAEGAGGASAEPFFDEPPGPSENGGAAGRAAMED